MSWWQKRYLRNDTKKRVFWPVERKAHAVGIAEYWGGGNTRRKPEEVRISPRRPRQPNRRFRTSMRDEQGWSGGIFLRVQEQGADDAGTFPSTSRPALKNKENLYMRKSFLALFFLLSCSWLAA